MRRPQVPELAEITPRRGNALSRWAGAWALAVLGWSFEGAIPEVAKAVVIVAPHTSNWDFFVGVAGMFALGLRVEFLGKSSLFVWPLGPVMRWLGGIPVDRTVSRGVVEVTARELEARDRMILALAPEGTRGPVSRWRSGFYHIARRAGVPIVPVSLDYRRRVIRLGGGFEATGDLEADLGRLRTFFEGVEGKRSK